MSLKVQINNAPKVNTRLKQIDFSLVKLEELTNVAEEVNGLQDGYTLVYDAVQERWVTQAVEGINNIDGGTF